jgi:hypothetical protein
LARNDECGIATLSSPIIARHNTAWNSRPVCA